MRRGFAPILIVVIAAISLLGIVLYQQFTSKTQPQPQSTSSPSPTDETANWKTYINTKYSYSFRYPSDWLMLSPGGEYGDKCVNSTDREEIIELAQKMLDSCGFIGESLPHPDANFTIRTLDGPWEKEEILTTDATGTDISEDIVLAGEKATKTPFTEKSDLPNIRATRVYFNHNSNGYLIFIKQVDVKGNYDPIFDQILSTFQFID